MDKSELKHYRALVMEVQQLREQLVTLESSLFSPKGQRFTTTPRAPSGERSTMDSAVERHIQLKAKYLAALNEKEARQLDIELAVEGLVDPAERVVMRERYIRGSSWAAIVRTMAGLGISERQVYRLHGLALLNLKEV